MIYKKLQRKLKCDQHEPPHGCSGRVNSSYSTSNIHRVKRHAHHFIWKNCHVIISRHLHYLIYTGTYFNFFHLFINSGEIIGCKLSTILEILQKFRKVKRSRLLVTIVNTIYGLMLKKKICKLLQLFTVYLKVKGHVWF